MHEPAADAPDPAGPAEPARPAPKRVPTETDTNRPDPTPPGRRPATGGPGGPGGVGSGLFVSVSVG
ncbi:hypothetical protein DMH08_36275, partial [Actinomadura sp. WAC 06369]